MPRETMREAIRVESPLELMLSICDPLNQHARCSPDPGRRGIVVLIELY